MQPNLLMKGARSLANGADFHLNHFLGRGMKPTFLILEVTERCNARCMMCQIWNQESPKDLDIKKLPALLSTDFFSDLWWINITGGEPFLRKDLPLLIDTLTAKCKSLMGISIPTNGLATDLIAKSVNLILKNHDDIFLSVTVSIDCFEQIHDKIRGTQGIFKQAIRTLEMLSRIRNSNFATGVEMVISKLNMSEIEGFYSHIKQYTDHINITPAIFSQNYFGNIEQQDMLSLSEGDKNKLVQVLAKISIENPVFAYYYDGLKSVLAKGKRSLPCVAGYKTMYINASGEVFPCHYLPKSFCLGNISTDEINSVWFSKKANDIRRKMKKAKYCRHCSSNCDLANAMTQESFDFLLFLLGRPNLALKIVRELDRSNYLRGYVRGAGKPRTLERSKYS